MPHYRYALRHGVVAAIEHDDIPYDHEFLTVVDVGANRGQFALVARSRFPAANLWCFEPLPAPRKTLEDVLRSHPNTVVLDVALSAQAGTSEMYISRRDDSSSLLPFGRQGEIFPGTDAVSSLAVKTARLDETLTLTEITAPALLKIDVQGAEFDVIEGSKGLIDAFDAILIECSFVELYVGQRMAAEVISLMGQLGWDVQGVYGASYARSGKCLQADILFVERTSTKGRNP